MSAATATSSKKRVIRGHAPRRAGRRYWAEGRSPRGLARSIGAASVGERGERMFYTPRGGSGVPRRAVSERAQPRQGHGLPLVAEPVHGLRAPLHVLLRPCFRAPRGPALRRALRALDPREGQRRRGAAP